MKPATPTLSPAIPINRRRSTFCHSPVLGPASDGNFLMFFKRLQNVAREGSPLQEREADWVKIIPPGNRKDECAEFEMTPERLAKYAEPWARWQASQNGGGEIFEGLPLTEWDGIAIERAEQLADQSIMTVEMLAAVTEANISRLGPGARELRERAKEHCLAKKQNAPLDELRRDQEALREQIGALAGVVKELADAIGGAGKKPKAA